MFIVVDSSRYYVVVLTDDRTGRSAPIGIMFPKEEKSRAFDFKVTIQNIQNGNKVAQAPVLHKTLADIGLGANPGGKISINLKGHSHSTPSRSSGLTSLPAPGSLAPPPSVYNTHSLISLTLHLSCLSNIWLLDIICYSVWVPANT